MSDLPTDAVRLLEVAREAMNPSDEDRQRVRRNLMAATAALAVAGGAAHTSASLGTSGAAASSTLKMGGAAGAWLTGGAKWLVAAAVTGTLAGTGYYTLQQTSSAASTTGASAMATSIVRLPATQPALAPAATTALQAADGAELAGEPVPAPAPAAAVDPAQVADHGAQTPASEHAAQAQDARSGERSAQRRDARGSERAGHAPKSSRHGAQEAPLSAAVTRLASSATAASTADGPQPTAAGSASLAAAHAPALEPQPRAAEPRLEAELALVRQASAALRTGRAQAALALLREHAARFPDGVLSEERDGLLALSLCAADDRSAERAAASFLARAPRSPLAARVRKSCSGTP